MTPMQWGLVGPGGIAHRFADALTTRPDATLRTVVGRSGDRTKVFAQRWGATSCLDLGAILADPAIDAVYIATPHHAHAEIATACLEAGKSVMCEKPLAVNASQAKSLIETAHERGVFLMEALWTRYLPALRAAETWIANGRIGAVRALQSSFGIHIPFDAAHRAYAPELAGGALLDIGIYNLSLSQWVMALQGVHDTPAMQAACVLAPTGVEQRCAVQMRYADGALSQFTCAFDTQHDNWLRVYGERGWLELGPHCWSPTEAVLHLPGAPPEHVTAMFAHNGFEYQIEAAMAAIRAGAIQEARMPHGQSLAVLTQIDTLRRELGTVRLPADG